MILGLLGGVLIGLLIATVGVVSLPDTTLSDFIENLMSAQFGEAMLAAGVGILAFIVSLIVIVLIHESGHLICGLLSGYKFVSFRIFNLTIINIDGNLQIKHYSIAGTGGQCLLTPPDLPIDKIPTGWYNFGGILFNIVIFILVLPLFLLKLHPLLTECLIIFLLTDALLIILNGIPMKISGTGNDGYNLTALRHDMASKRGLAYALRSNALIQNGVRPKDMPEEWFEIPDNIDYRNQLEAAIPMMAASRLVDEMKYDEALDSFETLYSHKDEIIPLYVKEAACELVFLRLVCGDAEGACDLLDNNLKKYIETYRKTMSSKERILCAIELFMENNPEKALERYNGLSNRQNHYLLQGEVKSDLAIMKDILSKEMYCHPNNFVLKPQIPVYETDEKSQ